MSKQPHERQASFAQVSAPGDSVKVSRRRFGLDAAAMAALTVSPISLLAGAREPGGENSAGAGPQSQAKAGDNSKLGITAEQAAEVEAKLANIVRKFGSRLSIEQREHLRRILAYNERMLAGVRAFELQNGDPPASVLRVSPRRESAQGRERRGNSAKPAGINKKQEGAR